MASLTDARQLGAAVRAERKRRGMSQVALAASAGVSRAWLARFETGHRAASIEQIFLVLRALGLAFELAEPKMTDGEAKLLAAFKARAER
ncbi:helix-turn-helix transcriptional regulator [Phytoactinopolyspora halotolerans]|uniref:Helix-turn-helix domain-containing protein n=1 Tax=Phytoactinopolyspora halotolerans TaxID=1981512 RepID=A0A6L9SF87_9ACTN|nr:helix-turn-helix domain-containing protein [Phytoactinopolyspora halotolerans]NEE03777.1 helix-turn-helix domain-containing protein [Phytoactinopolyspora halotolerans]